jgi:hypothetical protein
VEAAALRTDAVIVVLPPAAIVAGDAVASVV